jgi:hypothetical protein
MDISPHPKAHVVCWEAVRREEGAAPPKSVGLNILEYLSCKKIKLTTC